MPCGGSSHCHEIQGQGWNPEVPAKPLRVATGPAQLQAALHVVQGRRGPWLGHVRKGVALKGRCQHQAASWCSSAGALTHLAGCGTPRSGGAPPRSARRGEACEQAECQAPCLMSLADAQESCLGGLPCPSLWGTGGESLPGVTPGLPAGSGNCCATVLDLCGALSLPNPSQLQQTAVHSAQAPLHTKGSQKHTDLTKSRLSPMHPPTCAQN